MDDNKNKTGGRNKTICLLEKHLAFGACKKNKRNKNWCGWLVKWVE